MKKYILGLILAFSTSIFSLQAEVRLPKMISDGIVFQRNTEMKWWGYSDPNENVVITFKNKQYKTHADTQGNWNVVIPAQPAGGPYQVTVNNITVNDVLIGDVFLCSGQSNMELPISRVMDLYKEQVAAYTNENIHYIKLPMNPDFHEAQYDVKNGICKWLTLTPSQAPSFSAVCYFFAKEYYNQYKVPVGIINSSIGGTPVESWISEDVIKQFPEYYNDLQICKNNEYVESIQNLAKITRENWIQIMNRASSSSNSSDWRPVSLFSADWGFDGLRPINGLHLFRKEFNLTAEQAGSEAILRMGCIVDADSIFINGHFIGSTSYQYPPRIYKVKASYLKPGRNIIDVRLISYSGVPCFVPDKPYKLIFDKDEVSMKEGWTYQLAAKMPKMPEGITLYYKPCCLYNGMISPLLNFKFTAAVWYQGESNTGRYNDYAPLLKALIGDWRNRLNAPNLPFAIIQLPCFMHPQSPEQAGWTGLKLAQKEVAETTPRTVLIETSDVGEWNDIHPLNKEIVGNRIVNKLNTLISPKSK